jgi:hypothetical protein
MTIQTVVAWAQAQIKATAATKIMFAPDYPTDGNLSVPTSITLADNIRFQGGPQAKQILFDLHIDILIPRNALEDAMQWFAGVPLAVADLFRNDPTCGATAKTFDGDIVAKLVAQTSGGMDVIGYTITVPNIKLHE